MTENPKNQKILITGGAGYIGSVLAPLLLSKGYKVRVLDNLMHKQNSLISLFVDKNFEFIKGDIRKKEDVEKAVAGIDMIVHLAAIVGEPPCRREPTLAKEVNYGGTLNILEARQPGQKIFYASTGSNYGNVEGKIEGVCTEDTPLNPLSEYAITKTLAESAIKEAGNFVGYRFATGFGLSPRLRLDLMVNDFVWQALRNKALVIYEKDFMRTFIHVTDMAQSILHAIENFDEMKNQIYNVGDESLNFTKEQVVNKIKEKTGCWVHFAEFAKDPDQRNYEVSYEKIHSKGFKTQVTLDEGIEELINGLKVLEIPNPYFNV